MLFTSRLVAGNVGVVVSLTPTSSPVWAWPGRKTEYRRIEADLWGVIRQTA